MPPLTPYSFLFRGGMRLGRRGVSLEESGVSLPSDTLFAALVDAYVHLGGSAQAFVQPFLDAQPPFLLTSAFPLAGGLRFYPMPLDLRSVFSAQTLKERRKQLQRIAFFSEGLLKLALQGQRLDDYLFPQDAQRQPQKGAALQGGRLWFLTEENALLPSGFHRPQGRRHAWSALEVWRNGRVPRVTVDRLRCASDIYHAARVSFADGCGLWMGIRWLRADAAVNGSSETFRQAVERALAFLADEGLGGERSSGYGGFTLRRGAEFDLGGDPQDGALSYLLSRYCPLPRELPAALASPGAAYRLNAVGGWLRTPQGPAQRRRRVFLVQEGSLAALPQPAAGGMLDVRPGGGSPLGTAPHPVYRCGLACALAWKLADQGR